MSLDDGKLNYTVANFKTELYPQLSKEDKKLIDLFYLKFDNENLLKLLKDKEAECYVVDTADTSSRTFLWSYEAEGQVYQHEHIHGVSIGTFYDIALGGEGCLRKVCGVLQEVLNG